MQPKIFMIDDDKELCEEITEILIDEGYVVEVECDGLKGKEIVEKGGYDLLLLDLKLPGLSGFDILRSIREKNIKIKVIIVSGRPQHTSLKRENGFYENIDREEEDTLKLANGIISKPFDVKTILTKIKELLEV